MKLPRRRDKHDKRYAPSSGDVSRLRHRTEDYVVRLVGINRTQAVKIWHRSWHAAAKPDQRIAHLVFQSADQLLGWLLDHAKHEPDFLKNPDLQFLAVKHMAEFVCEAVDELPVKETFTEVRLNTIRQYVGGRRG